MTLSRVLASLLFFLLAAPCAGATSPSTASESASASNDASALQAFGDDPTWTVVVDARGMSMSVEEDGEPVFRELSPLVVSEAGSDRVFRTNTAVGTPVELRIAKAPCAGSSEQLPMHATLSVGSMRREGCARMLEDMEASATRPLLGDLAMDSRIVSKGGPTGYALDIQETGTMVNIGGRVLNLRKPVTAQIGNTPWPTIAGNVATYALVDDDETVTATATAEAASCKANGKTYPLTLSLVFEARTYRSCASQAYKVLNIQTLSIPTVANPN
jgi:uncharacterized membrane protein